MQYLDKIIALLRDWIPFLITLLIAIVVITAAYQFLIKRRGKASRSIVSQQILIALVGGILVVIMILQLPIDDAPRGQLLSLLGILVTAAVALSSTTLLGNAMAGFMLRSIRNFRPGDFIVIDEHRGRVSELGLLRTEIQTERRNLTTLPNLYLVSNPVTVVRSSGTFIASTISLGYDVPREKVDECLVEAASEAGLTDAFVFVLDLGDFSIKYQVAGFLEEVKYLLSAESRLRECMLDSLHRNNVEIVSPTFMNQRQLAPEQVFIPEESRRAKLQKAPEAEARPEERMFDKAELAELEADVKQRLKQVVKEIEALEKSREGSADGEEPQARLAELEGKRAELEAKVKEFKASKEEEEKEESEDEEREPS